jgi:hypothetical protein
MLSLELAASSWSNGMLYVCRSFSTLFLNSGIDVPFPRRSIICLEALGRREISLYGSASPLPKRRCHLVLVTAAVEEDVSVRLLLFLLSPPFSDLFSLPPPPPLLFGRNISSQECQNALEEKEEQGKDEEKQQRVFVSTCVSLVPVLSRALCRLLVVAVVLVVARRRPRRRPVNFPRGRRNRGNLLLLPMSIFALSVLPTAGTNPSLAWSTNRCTAGTRIFRPSSPLLALTNSLSPAHPFINTF